MIRKTVIVVLTILAVGTAGLWVLSLRWHSAYFYRVEEYTWIILVADGGLGVNEVRSTEGSPPSGWHSGVNRRRPGLGDLQWEPWFRMPLGGMRMTFVPFWIPFVLFAAYPTWAFIRGPLRRRRRRKRGECAGCGYNLTGNVSGVCPECGAAV